MQQIYFIADIISSFFSSLGEDKDRSSCFKKKKVTQPSLIARQCSASIQIYIVLAKQVPLEVAFEVRLIIADAAVEIRRFTARHFLV